jgi:hypothetical protein
VWRAAAAELDGYRRAYGLDHPGPAKHGGARVAWDGRGAAPATPSTDQAADGTRERPRQRSDGERRRHRSDWPRRATVAVDQHHRAGQGRLLGAEPRRDAPGRRSDWHRAWTALERLTDHHRHRGDRHRLSERPGRLGDRDSGRAERDGR